MSYWVFFMFSFFSCLVWYAKKCCFEREKKRNEKSQIGCQTWANGGGGGGSIDTYYDNNEEKKKIQERDMYPSYTTFMPNKFTLDQCQTRRRKATTNLCIKKNSDQMKAYFIQGIKWWKIKVWKCTKWKLYRYVFSVCAQNSSTCLLLWSSMVFVSPKKNSLACRLLLEMTLNWVTRV